MRMLEESVLRQVSDELQSYVYLLVDPADGVPFYVGKGHRMRHASHLAEALNPVDEEAGSASRKTAMIRELAARGDEPQVWILRYGLSKTEYTAVEAATIDLLSSFQVIPQTPGEFGLAPLALRENLTNARREYSRGHGIRLLQSLVEEFAAPDLETSTPLLLITLNGWDEYPDGELVAGGKLRYKVGYNPEWLPSEARRSAFDQIGESVSAWWSLDTQKVSRLGIQHVVAIHQGFTRALFKIVPGSWEYNENRVDKRGRVRRLTAFRVETIESGPLFDETVGPYGRRVPGRSKNTQNAIYYWPR